MTPEDVIKAQGLILRGFGLDAVCDALGCTRRTLERAFVAAHGTTPARWAKQQTRAAAGIVSGGASRVVAFRLASYSTLAEAAAAEGVTPSELAKSFVLDALSRLRVKSGGKTS